MASKKITQLTATTSVGLTDILPVVTSPSTSPVTKKITIDDFVGSLRSITPTITVASNGASDLEKAGADYLCDGTADNVQIQSAIDSLSSSGGTVVYTKGDYAIASPIVPASKVNLVGMGQNTRLLSTASDIFKFPVGGANEYFIYNLKAEATGGHIFNLDDGGCTQLLLNRLWMYQHSSDKAVWYCNNNDSGTLHLSVIDNNIYAEGSSRSVPAWIMKDASGFGNTNANWFERNLCTYGDSCNDQPFFFLEAAINGDYIYANQFHKNTFELCLGGAFDLRSTFGTVLDGNNTWLEGGTAVGHFISMSKSSATGALSPTNNSIKDCSRFGSGLDASYFDVKLTGHCRSTQIWGFRSSPDTGRIDVGSSTDCFIYGLSGGTAISNVSSTTIIDKSGGKIGSGVVPTARFHAAGSTTTAGSAPIKIDSGTLMTSAEDGAFEYNGTHLYFTVGTNRVQLT